MGLMFASRIGMADVTAKILCEWDGTITEPASASYTIKVDGVDAASGSVNQSDSWRGTVEIPAGSKYELVLDAGRGIKSESTSYGCALLLELRMSYCVVTRSGYETLSGVKLSSEILTEYGWENLLGVNLSRWVATDDYDSGVLFVVKNTKTANDLTSESIAVELEELDSYLYDGSAKTPSVTIKDSGELLTEGVQYSVGYENNVNAGDALITITGIGEYVGSVSTNFTILKRKLGIEAPSIQVEYDGQYHHTNPSVQGYDGMAPGEGVTFAEFTEIKNVTKSGNNVLCQFKTIWNDNTLMSNYEVVRVGYGTIQILPRQLTVCSRDLEQSYDGTPLVLSALDLFVENGLVVDGEYLPVGNFASITEHGETDAAFSVAAGLSEKFPVDGSILADLNNYSITSKFGKLRITNANINDGGISGKGNLASYSGVYDGNLHGINVKVSEPESGYSIRYSTAQTGIFLDEMPRYKDVCDGIPVWYEITAPGYNALTNWAAVTILPKPLTADMCVLGDDVFFFDGTEKKPAVVVVDGDPNIATDDDYALDYGTKTGAGKVPVTITGKNNYTGVINKEFEIMKRPVAPPVVGSKSYNKKKQTATITADDRWTVIANAGGIEVGEYEVVLRLTNTDDYKWKGGTEEATDWAGVFRITRASNGWSRYPGIDNWTEGETISEPVGQVRYGTLLVSYRSFGQDVDQAVFECPTKAGKYVARFWVEETENFIGVAAREVEFEIYSASGDTQLETQTTPAPVPHSWLDAYVEEFGAGDYEAAGHALGANGRPLWENYVAGLDPEDAASEFKASIAFDADGRPTLTWEPDLREADPPRTYTEYGKVNLADETWTPVTDANRESMHFFKVEVELE